MNPREMVFPEQDNEPGAGKNGGPGQKPGTSFSQERKVRACKGGSGTRTRLKQDQSYIIGKSALAPFAKISHKAM